MKGDVVEYVIVFCASDVVVLVVLSCNNTLNISFGIFKLFKLDVEIKFLSQCI